MSYGQKGGQMLAIDEPLNPAELAMLEAEHIGSDTINDANISYSGPGCPRCNEPWPCRVSRLIRLVQVTGILNSEMP